MTNTIVDSTDTVKYNAYISGRSYQDEDYPKLDSIKFYIKHKYYQTNTTTIIEKQKPQKQNKWGVTIGIGGGYGLIQKKPDIYVGVTLGYKIF